MRIDLHCHSSVSDGTRTPAEVVRRAHAAGLSVVALTDHDTQRGVPEARAALPTGMTLVPGMELSCRLDGHSVHLLAYCANPAHPALAAECAAILDGRVARAKAMVERLRELGADITWDRVAELAGDAVVGRPHIADALAEAGVVGDQTQAFTAEWIGAGGRAHVSRYALDPVRAISLVSEAGGVSVLAHPGATGRGWKISDDQIAKLALAGMAGLEVDHPNHDDRERLRLRAVAVSLGLVASGGSDDHGERTGDRIGCELADPRAYQALMARVAVRPGHGDTVP